jgi:alkylation response protein AidB-like acyl-CoA dehydrogenase
MDKMDESQVKIAFSEEAAMLMDAAVTFARDQIEANPIRASASTRSGFNDATWAQMVDLGWAGLLVPEEHGGSGLGLNSAVPIVEALGARLIASPLKATMLATFALREAGQSNPALAWLSKIARDGAVATLALADGNGWDWRNPRASAKRNNDRVTLTGEKRFVPFADAADVVVASVSLDGHPALVALSRAMLDGRIIAEDCVDSTQRPASLRLDGLEVGEQDVIDAVHIERLAHAGAVLESAEMCGGAWGAIEYTIQYLKTRVQFGRLIGSYQSLKHTMSDAYVQYELLRSLVYAAASNLDTPDGELLARMAKAKADEVFVHVADRAIQFHGGFGFTYDCDAGFYLRRALWSQSQFGNARHHRKRLAALVLDGNPATA